MVDNNEMNISLIGTNSKCDCRSFQDNINTDEETPLVTTPKEIQSDKHNENDADNHTADDYTTSCQC